jgi:RNA polymerase sigma factor (sigma-70 family)
VKSLLKPDAENDIEVAFASPVKYVEAKQAQRAMPGVSQAIPGGPYLRKAPCQFGWDWGPQLPPVGIWKDIRLEGRSSARLEEVHLRQHHAEGQVTVEAHVIVERWGDAPLTASVRVTAPDGETLQGEAAITSGSNEAVVRVQVARPQLWWPNGYGEQPLYTVDVALRGGDQATNERLGGPEEEASRRTLEGRFDETLRGLSDRERQIVQMRYGLTNDRPRTLEEAAKEFGITPERMRQIETRVLRKLPHARYGEQPLYTVKVDPRGGGAPLDERTYTVGLRTIELRQEPDQWGRSFEFVVNGVRIFAKGSNWIPADSFPTRITDEYLEGLIRSAAESHQNMLRVWGGGFYEEERFYDLCDRYGILVWQEFIFSCSIYPLDDAEFLENVRVEAVENVRRIRHRASLALWCGNNEMEWGWADWGWDRPDLQDMKAAYLRFFHATLPEWCAAEDPDTSYWPSSPSSDTPFEDPNGQVQGDAHYWDVWHGRQPFTAYRGQYPRFMSEFGFQALPPMPTIRTYAEEPDWNMTSYIMEQHQKNASGNSLMVGQMLDTFRLPRDFESLVYLSMALQAEGIRYGVEHWRRHMDRVAGTLYWQLNDCWPVASWSSLDYFGRWKALHYAARRFFAPVLLSVEDDGDRQTVHVTSDLREPWRGTVRWTLETLRGDTLESGEGQVEVPPLSSVAVRALDFADRLTDDSRRETVFTAELLQGDRLIARQVATFVPTKHLSLEPPGLSATTRLDGGVLSIELTSRSLARMVEVSLDGADVVFSDNYFDLPAGRTVTITCPLPEGWTAEQTHAALKTRTVYESYSQPAKE